MSPVLARLLAGFSPLTIGLGITMTVSYGVLFYSFAILAPVIMRDFGWSRTFVFGAFSAALVAGAILAPVSGRLLDRHGGRFVLSLGTVISSLALASMMLVQNPASFFAALFAIEATATFVQYEAGFGALTQYKGNGARPYISAVTLIAGFSSTLFWPFCGWLIQHLTWRETYLVLAAVNLVVSLPIHLMLPRHSSAHATGEVAHSALPAYRPVAQGDRRRVLVLLAISFSAGGFVVAAVQSHFPRIFVEAGYTVVAATAFGAMIGPFQVGSRIIELLYGQRHHPVRVGIIANCALVVGVAFLLAIGLGWFTAILFAIFFGTGQGLAHIVRGAVPLALFGPTGYGRLTGNLGFVRILATASAPFLVALLSDTFSNQVSILFVAAVAAISMLALLPLASYAK
ncbi:MAG: MFS transporter [Rhizobiaceae bacterium]